jgi:hypothetical protein
MTLSAVTTSGGSGVASAVSAARNPLPDTSKGDLQATIPRRPRSRLIFHRVKRGGSRWIQSVNCEMLWAVDLVELTPETYAVGGSLRRLCFRTCWTRPQRCAITVKSRLTSKGHIIAAELPKREHASSVLPRSLALLSNPMRQALASVRAEGLEPDAVGMDFIRRVDAGELSTEEAIEAYASQFVID